MTKEKISDEQIKIYILEKFYFKRAGVKYHIHESDIPKGFPPHIRKRVLKNAKELYREGLLVRYPHKKEHVWRMNIKRIDEIKKLIHHQKI